MDLEALAKALRASRVPHKEIAAKANVGENTVQRFLSGATTKLTLGTYQSLRDYAVEVGLIVVSSPVATPQAVVVAPPPVVAQPPPVQASDERARYAQLIAWLDDEYFKLSGVRPSGEWAARRDLNAFRTYGSFHQLSPLRALSPADLDVLRRNLPAPRGRTRPPLAPSPATAQVYSPPAEAAKPNIKTSLPVYKP